MLDEYAIGIQTTINGYKKFVVFWDYDSSEDYYYKWYSFDTMGM